jgi:hypothetical protein
LQALNEQTYSILIDRLELRTWCEANLVGFWQIDSAGAIAADANGPVNIFLTLTADEDITLAKLRWSNRLNHIGHFDTSNCAEPAFSLEEIAPPVMNFEEEHPALAMFTEHVDEVSLWNIGRVFDATPYEERTKDLVRRVLDWCADNLTDYRVQNETTANALVAIRGDEDRALFKLKWLPNPRITPANYQIDLIQTK